MAGEKILFLENPLLDIQGVGDEAMLQQYDLKANDAILADRTKHSGLFDDLILNRDAKLIAGGSAQNSARGAQYLLPDNSVVYFGGVGRDSYAETLKKEADKAGIRAEYRQDESAPTGRCGVIITGHNRSLCTDLGAANNYDLDHLKAHWADVEQADLFFVGGYHVTVCVPAIMALAKEAADKNKSFFFSLSAPFILEFFKDAVDSILPYCDYVIGNEAEAAAYAKAHGLADLTSVEQIAAHVAALPKHNSSRPRTVIFTQGTDPTIVAIGSQNGSIPAISSYPVHAIAKEEIVDTNGAGDAFAAGFVAGLAKKEDAPTCVDMGQWLAALSLTELGPSYPYPKKQYEKQKSNALVSDNEKENQTLVQ